MAMASTLHHLYLLLISFSLLSLSSATNLAHSKPTTLVLPVQKDGATGLHVAAIHKRTPPLSLPFVIDLNGRFLWVNCEQHYLSSTYTAPFCHSTQCSRASSSHYCHKCSAPPKPGCHNNTCGVILANPLTRRTAIGELALDVLSILSNLDAMATVPHFLFACAPSFLLQGPLPKNVQGVAGLGHQAIALPTQLASNFGFRPRFAICLTSTTTNGSSGAIFFGNGPLKVPPGVDVSHPTSYTPLTISPQGEYCIQVTMIKIKEKPVPFNTSLLFRNKEGLGGTSLSTTTPYTILEHSIFTSLAQLFASQLADVPQVKPVSPFGLCFDSSKLRRTRIGLGVPSIDFALHDGKSVWRMLGANSVVEVGVGVACLAFVDGGVGLMRDRGSSIVIGAYQMEDNLLHFDLAASKLGFGPSLLFRRTSCANFNFNFTTSSTHHHP